MCLSGQPPPPDAASSARIRRPRSRVSGARANVSFPARVACASAAGQRARHAQKLRQNPMDSLAPPAKIPRGRDQ